MTVTPFVVTIGGSPSTTSRSSAVLAYFARELTARSIEARSINVRDMPADDLIHGRYDSASIKDHIDLVARAQGVIIATPVYKAAYTGVLKLFLDVLPQNALAGKAVLPIVSGAAPNHMLVLDYALKPVLAALGADRIMAGMYLLDSQFVPATEPNTPPGFSPELEARLQSVLDIFVSQLREVEQR